MTVGHPPRCKGCQKQRQRRLFFSRHCSEKINANGPAPVVSAILGSGLHKIALSCIATHSIIKASASKPQCLKIYRQLAAMKPCNTRSVGHISLQNIELQPTNPLLQQRNIPVRGLKPVYYILGVGLVMAYGWRKLFLGGREQH